MAAEAESANVAASHDGIANILKGSNVPRRYGSIEAFDPSSRFATTFDQPQHEMTSVIVITNIRTAFAVEDHLPRATLEYMITSTLYHDQS